MDIRVSEAELRVLAALLGQETLYGIADPFSGAGESRKAELLKQVRRSLRQKKLLSRDFEGNGMIPAAVQKRLAPLLRPEKLLLFQKKDGKAVERNYYFAGETVLRAWKQEELWQLEEVADWKRDVLELADPGTVSELTDLSAELSMNCLQQAREQGDETRLIEAGLSPEAAGLLLKGLLGGAFFASLTLLQPGSGSLRQWLFLRDQDLGLQLVPSVNAQFENVLRFGSAGRRAIESLKRLLDRFEREAGA